jgi:penicillin-binding protein 2
MDPLQPADERRVPISPQLAFRVAVLGGIAFALFAVIFFRLWYLQVLSSTQYIQQADQNRQRNVAIPAPRGEITDRNGRPIAGTRETTAVEVSLNDLPVGADARRRLYRRLGHVLGMSGLRINRLVDEGRVRLPYADVTIKTDVTDDVRNYLAERQLQFPGVLEQAIYVRRYPLGDFAAQVLGYVGQISKPELKYARYRGVGQGTVVGQSGVEAEYDRYLRGTPGAQRIEVDATGHAQTTLSERLPIAGHRLRLTLDSGLQAEGEKAIQQGMALANGNGNPAQAGGFVALDPRNGQVLALGSYPTFDPNSFVRPLTIAEYQALLGVSSGGPSHLFNRAIDGQYPTGSTFKPISAMGGLMSGLITPGTTMGGGSCVTISGRQFCNAGHVDDGDLALQDALRVSEDTYFYELGAMANTTKRHGGVIQAMARRLGLGRSTGIDVPGEAPGNVPDPAWRAHQGVLEREYERKHHVPCCTISDGRPWSVGDNVNFATGQGDLEATPLQMAVVYSTLANAFMNNGYGTVVRPHIGLEVDDSQGALIQKIASRPARHVRMNPSDLAVVMAGLHDAASAPGGTSADVWTGWNQAAHPVYGKTGTAQHVNQADQSWYVCYIPDPKRPIVIAVTIEQGGFGAQAAAPAARLMAEQWFGQKLVVKAGTSLTL